MYDKLSRQRVSDKYGVGQGALHAVVFRPGIISRNTIIHVPLAAEVLHPSILCDKQSQRRTLVPHLADSAKCVDSYWLLAWRITALPVPVITTMASSHSFVRFPKLLASCRLRLRPRLTPFRHQKLSPKPLLRLNRGQGNRLMT
jgi:hypothetical protein